MAQKQWRKSQYNEDTDLMKTRSCNILVSRYNNITRLAGHVGSTFIISWQVRPMTIESPTPYKANFNRPNPCFKRLVTSWNQIPDSNGFYRANATDKFHRTKFAFLSHYAGAYVQLSNEVPPITGEQRLCFKHFRLYTPKHNPAGWITIRI